MLHRLVVLNVVKVFGGDHKNMSKIGWKNWNYGFEKVE